MSQQLAERELACAEVCQKPAMCPQRPYLSVPRELPCSSCQTGTAVEVRGGRAGWCPGRGSSLRELSAPCSSLLLPTPSCIPGHQHLACHRLGAMGNGTSRWQSALQRSLECPQTGEAPAARLAVRGNPGPSAIAVGTGSCPMAPASSGWVGSGPGFSAAFCSALLWGRGLGQRLALRATFPSSLPLAGSVALGPFPSGLPSF